MKHYYFWFGWLLIVVGVLFGLTTLNIVAYDFVQFWPVLFIIGGIVKVMHYHCKGDECCK